MNCAATVGTAPLAIRPVTNAAGLRQILMATAALALAGNVLFACVGSSSSDSDSGWTISSSSDSSSSDSGGDSGGGGDGGGE